MKFHDGPKGITKDHSVRILAPFIQTIFGSDREFVLEFLASRSADERAALHSLHYTARMLRNDREAKYRKHLQKSFLNRTQE